jgi:hypothetical protein
MSILPHVVTDNNGYSHVFNLHLFFHSQLIKNEKHLSFNDCRILE